jgi:hypothetical protein
MMNGEAFSTQRWTDTPDVPPLNDILTKTYDNEPLILTLKKE